MGITSNITPDEDLFRLINRPYGECSFGDVITALMHFKEQYKGKLAIQMMFVGVNKEHAPQVAKIIEQLHPNEVQINTPLRPCTTLPLSPKEISIIRQSFTDFERVITVYETSMSDVVPLNKEEALRRRPRLRKNIGKLKQDNK